MPDFDPVRRQRKAAKIVRALQNELKSPGNDSVTLLDIGCGSAHITDHFADFLGSEGRVSACDLIDTRSVRDDKFEFRLSPKNGTIPWQENSFDVVVSNFVMEHVGPQTAQQMHIREIARVLKPGGFCYLAVPNSWCVREAHTFLWFVTWMPEAWQEPYVCWRTKRKRFGTWTPSRRSVRRMCRHVGLNLRATTIDTMRDYAALEPVGRLTRWICRSPTLLLRSLMGMVPSMTFILEKPRETARENHKDFTNQQPSQLHHSQT